MADRLALIIEGLCHAVARRVGLRGIAGPFIILVWSRLRRIKARFAQAAASSPIPSRPAARRRAAPSRPSPPHPLPRRKAWLLRLMPDAASGASQLRHFLADPEVATLLATAPQLGSILRPLCHMLGIRAAGTRATQTRPPSAQPPDAAPAARLIPCLAPSQAAAATAPPIAVPPWTTPPPSPDPAPPSWPFQQRHALPEPSAPPPASA